MWLCGKQLHTGISPQRKVANVSTHIVLPKFNSYDTTYDNWHLRHLIHSMLVEKEKEITKELKIDDRFEEEGEL